MNSTTVESGRRLQIFNGDDYIMLPDLGPEDGPSRITMCEARGVLTGFQVFYGTYNPKAGSAHGDLTTDCISSLINEPVIEVAFFGSPTQGSSYIEGMTISIQPFHDGTFPGQIIKSGKVNQLSQKKRSVRFPNNSGSGPDIFLFFGFKSTSTSKTISNISILTYDPQALYNSRYNFTYLKQSKTITLDSVESKLKVLGILENRDLMKIMKAEPNNKTIEVREEHVQSTKSGTTGMIMVLVLGLLFLAVPMVIMIRV